MIDVISLSIALGAVLVSILTHIKHSECFGVKIDTRTPKNTPPSTPYEVNQIPQISETQPLLHYENNQEQNSPAILQPTQPINIPPKPKIKNWL
jgi:hypothetical protein